MGLEEVRAWWGQSVNHGGAFVLTVHEPGATEAAEHRGAGPDLGDDRTLWLPVGHVGHGQGGAEMGVSIVVQAEGRPAGGAGKWQLLPGGGELEPFIQPWAAPPPAAQEVVLLSPSPSAGNCSSEK